MTTAASIGTPADHRPATTLLACHECDLLLRDPFPRGKPPALPHPLTEVEEVCCPRCGARLYRVAEASLDRALALALAALIVFLIANAFPIASIDAQGHRNDSTLLGAVRLLWQQDMGLIATLVCLTTVVVPFLELLVIGATLLLLRLGHPLQTLRRLPRALRLVLSARPWSMIEVFMLGVLVSLVKLAHLASLTPGVALWAYGILMVLLAALSSTVNLRKLWAAAVSLPETVTLSPRAATGSTATTDAGSAQAAGWQTCHTCGLLSPLSSEPSDCPRCATPLHTRTPHSLASAWALLLAAAILFLPANLLPIMETGSLFGFQQDTILSGVVFLWESGSWPLALLVFIASIAVPLFKLLMLGGLLLSVQLGWQQHRHARTRLYRILELIGRWSMLDIYVVTILSALVQIQSLATITVGAGALAFGAVVVLTMLATMRFDPRLIWDADTTGNPLHHG
ncbi:MAG TPA: PqiA/YebS family transporter subunit [Rhodocyclaceae bacterium]|nr:PqiA/YebS family transporter subunit [Rhodocyclaceae bacterium]